MVDWLLVVLLVGAGKSESCSSSRRDGAGPVVVVLALEAFVAK